MSTITSTKYFFSSGCHTKGTLWFLFHQINPQLHPQLDSESIKSVALSNIGNFVADASNFSVSRLKIQEARARRTNGQSIAAECRHFTLSPSEKFSPRVSRETQKRFCRKYDGEFSRLT